ncbi:MAG TPA: bifunctional YncE family protein/alkaline phosphatase family protein, partial [Rhodothermales bacterium]|nr:bifunctional YncE family protein/alkaline phosphatase family protein [Rhodothermales bacterium]
MKASGILLLTVLALAGCRHLRSDTSTMPAGWLPTGVALDPAAPMFDVGPLPLEMVRAPEGDRYVLLLSGWSEQGVQVVDPSAREVTQNLVQPAAFVGVCFSRDGRTLFASGGDHDVVYRYTWANGRATLADSLVLAPRKPRAHGTRYPAGLAVSPDGRSLYVAENLADSLAVVDLASGRVTQHLATGRYPYEVAVAPDGTVYVSAWGASHVAVFSPGNNGSLVPGDVIPVGYHPSALLLSRDGGRLFVTSSSTDEIRVIDTATRETVATLHDPAPAGPHEGSTPNALALSPEGTRLFVAEADNNAVAVFDLSPSSSGISATAGKDRLAGRIPVGWYPTALAVSGDTLLVANGKGLGTGPNVDGPHPDGRPHSDKDYTLGQLSGTVSVFAGVHASDGTLASLGQRVQRANNWTRAAQKSSLPPFKHVIYIIKENRTYDQVLGDMPGGDGDTSLLYFPRAVTPNHHALADKFGLFDRFFVNAEVSAQGHNWSMAAYS